MWTCKVQTALMSLKQNHFDSLSGAAITHKVLSGQHLCVIKISISCLM